MHGSAINRSALRSGVERLEPRQLFAAWQNPADNLDVDQSDQVTAVDALYVINHLNSLQKLLIDTPSGENPLVDVNGDNRVSPVDALLVINELNARTTPLTLTWSIAPEDDPNGNDVVANSDVRIEVQATANADLRVQVESLDAQYQQIQSRTNRVSMGANSVNSLGESLYPGLNRVTITVQSSNGRATSISKQIMVGDSVIDWNASILNVIRAWTGVSNDPYQGRVVPSQPPMAARNIAMIHLAMFDAVNAIDGNYLAYVQELPPVPLGASAIAAGASAAYTVASNLYNAPKELAIWSATLVESLSKVQDEQCRNDGVEFGRAVGLAMLAARANDGARKIVSFEPGTEPGDWNRTFPDFLPALLPQWPQVKPFGVKNIEALRPDAPPPLDSQAYAEAVDEVMQLGSLDSTARTAEQEEIALFWADGGGTATPPGHWNRIAENASLIKQLSLVDNAHLFAMLNMALADAGIAAWDSKYAFNLWRPIDAIRQADVDGNAATVADANWLPLLRTPPFPSYVSGHSTFSSAAATVLTELFGDEFTFSSTTDPQNAPSQRPLSAKLIVTRHFSSFNQAAQEAGLSRIYGGIHFSFDNEAGQTLGEAVGQEIVELWAAG
ncbi:MAG: phosphatase PAP2 family protein [Pirellulales bacterium]